MSSWLSFPHKWMPRLRVALQVFSCTKTAQKTQNNKNCNKAIKPRLAKPRRQIICRLSWDKLWVCWFVVPEQITAKQHSLRCAMLSVTDWVKSEISVYGSCAYTEGCQHGTLVCLQKHSEEESGDFLLNSRKQTSLSQIKWLPHAILSLNISFEG